MLTEIEVRCIVRVIPHDQQRYPTVGDWLTPKDGPILIHVSDMGNPKYEALVAVHELVEALLCQARGITQQQVDDFDMKWKGEGEPGDDPRAPYHCEHFEATIIEMMLCRLLGVDWNDYAAAVEAL